MIRLKNIVAITSFCIASLAIVGCEDKNSGLTDNAQNQQVNKWVYSEMNRQYLYYKDMPAQDKVDFGQDPKTFLVSLLSRNQEMKVNQNGREYFYSYIEVPEKTKASINAATTYGMQFIRYSRSDRPGYEFIRITYVLPGSPAEQAGLKRGDFIYKAGGEFLNATNTSLLISGGEINVYKGQFKEGTNTFIEYADPVKLGAAVYMEENPIHYTTTFNLGSAKVGYVLYNAFKFGPSDQPVEFPYEIEMKQMMKSFRDQGVTDLILDLRYNGGGYLRTAKLLASTLIGEKDLGKLMAIEEMNDKLNDQNNEKEVYFYKAADLDGANLNLKRLVVIATNYTASSSELIINCLRPYMPVIHVGERTEGKNVGSYSITNSKFPGYKLQPITIKIYNALKQSDYRNGFMPDSENEYDELSSPRMLVPFGSYDDIYLQKAFKALGIAVPVVTGTKAQSRSVEYRLDIAGSYELPKPKGILQ